MDNLTHTLAGAVLARTGLGNLSKRGTAALIIASNLPDVDSVVAFKGSLFYLEHHRGITHSIPGLVPLALGVAFPLAFFFRGRERPRFWILTALSLLGLAIHVFMDYFNSYGVRPFLPFDGTWFYGDLAFILDPWMWLLLGGALFLSSPGGRARTAGWLALGMATSFAVVIGSLDGDLAVPRAAVALWFFGLVSLGLARNRLRGARVPRVALGCLAVYWALLSFMHRSGLKTIETEAQASFPGESIHDTAALPTAAHPGRWIGIVDTGHDLLLKNQDGWVRLTRRLEHPAVRAARASCAGQTLFRFFRYPVAEVELERDSWRVILRDARYRITGRSGFAAATLALTPELTPLHPPSPCPAPAAWAARPPTAFPVALLPQASIECRPVCRP